MLHSVAWIFFGMVLGGGLLAASLRNVLHAIFGLAISLLGVAGLFLSLGSPFLAAMEVLIYIGGISVAMVFAVMLSYSISAQTKPARLLRHFLASIGALGFFLALGLTIARHPVAILPSGVAGDGSVPAIGRALLNEYNLIFEALSIILLMAIVGAIAIARKEPKA
ncbi:MAG: NADH-quinone oxidoreductase subunit J [Deltaproteobacteria bacterium]|nr:NADH-quinone oxidoreductase subunit J [Deltaproteobacteria bacterium]